MSPIPSDRLCERSHIVEVPLRRIASASVHLEEILDCAEAGAGDEGFDMSKRVHEMGDGRSAEFLCLHFSSRLVATAVAELANGTLLVVERKGQFSS